VKPILSAAQMRWADMHTIKVLGVSGSTLMENAGRAVAEQVRERLCRNSLVLVVAGPGNNGGDGLAAALWLLRWKLNVQVVLLGHLDVLRGDAAEHARRAISADVHLSACADVAALDATQHVFDHAGLIVDTIFGTGLARPLDGLMAHAANRINAAPAPVLSVDIASGIDSDNGRILGGAVRASWTLPIAAYKWGHWLGEGREYAGEILPPAAIGIDADTISRAQSETRGTCRNARLIEQGDIRAAYPPRPHICHKRDFGHTWIFGGSIGYTGAPRLAAGGAYAVGAGLVSIACPNDVYTIVAATSLEVMVHPEQQAPWQKADVILAGPGWGTAQGARLAELLETDIPLVLDADALNMLSVDAELARNTGRRRALTVMTPHPGEAGRLLGSSSHEIQADRLHAVLAIAKKYRAWVVLKGADTLIASPERDVWVCPFGTPKLAVAGTGDVLSGMIAGLIGKGLPAAVAIPAAVGQHALAGERNSWYLAGDLCRLARAVLQDVGSSPA